MLLLMAAGPEARRHSGAAHPGRQRHLPQHIWLLRTLLLRPIPECPRRPTQVHTCNEPTAVKHGGLISQYNARHAVRLLSTLGESTSATTCRPCTAWSTTETSSHYPSIPTGKLRLKGASHPGLNSPNLQGARPSIPPVHCFDTHEA